MTIKVGLILMNYPIFHCMLLKYWKKLKILDNLRIFPVAHGIRYCKSSLIQYQSYSASISQLSFCLWCLVEIKPFSMFTCLFNTDVGVKGTSLHIERLIFTSMHVVNFADNFAAVVDNRLHCQSCSTWMQILPKSVRSLML